MLFGSGMAARIVPESRGGIAGGRGRFWTADGMDEKRRKTLEALLEIAAGDDPRSCWDPSRARELLRNQSSLEELKEAGAREEILAELWPERTGDR